MLSNFGTCDLAFRRLRGWLPGPGDTPPRNGGRGPVKSAWRHIVRLSVFAAAAAALIAVPAGGRALAGGYAFTTLSDPSGTFGTVANGINDAGTVVGTYTDATSNYGFTESGGSYANFNVPGATSTSAQGINAAGTVVGYYGTSTGGVDGFTLSGGAYSYPLSATFPATPAFAGASGATYGLGINATGATVGYFFDAGGNSHGFVSGLSTPIDATSLGAVWTITTGINNAGTSVGYYATCTGPTCTPLGFERTAGGTISGVNDPLGVNGTYVTGINDLGQITGYYLDASGNTDGFVLTGTDYVTIDAPGSFNLTQVNGINDSGAIVGDYLN